VRRDSFKLLILAGVLGFAVLYGMELSSKGIENVGGSWETDGSAATADGEGDWTLPVKERRDDGRLPNERRPSAAPDKSPLDANENEYAIPRADREPIVDRVSGKTAEVLHDLSRGGIRMIVSLFDKVLG